MKRIVIVFLLLGLIPKIDAQNSKQTITILKKVADTICKENIRKFKDLKTEKEYANIKTLKNVENISLISRYSDWRYTSGVMNIAMLRLGNLLNDEKYINFSKGNYKFIFDNLPYLKNRPENRSKYSFPFGQYYAMEKLDDCGAMGAGLIDLYKIEKETRYLNYINKAAEYIMYGQVRLNDGTLCRPKPSKMTVWADDLFMSVPFLARMGELSGEDKYFDDAAKQIIKFTNYLWDENTGLYFHAWQSDDSTNGVAHWGRANGWVIVAQIELLKKLPKKHSQREKLLSILKQQINGIARYQSKSGLWHQLLDKEDSYLETSCTSMFVYGIAAAVNEGWVKERYISVALNGWKGLLTETTPDGKIKNVCIGTGIKDNLIYYYTRPVKTQDSHGTGAYILAGTEIARYLINKEINVGR